MKCFVQATDHVWQEKGWPRPPCGQGSAADDSSVAHSLLCKGRMCWDSFRNPPNPLNFTSQLFKSILSGPDDLLTSTYPYCTLPLFGSLFGTNSSTKTDLLDLAQPGVGLLGQIQNQSGETFGKHQPHILFSVCQQSQSDRVNSRPPFHLSRERHVLVHQLAPAACTSHLWRLLSLT